MIFDQQMAVGRVALGEQTRARLLDAAIDRLAQGGPAVNFDLIGADVGVTKGALYHHFGSVDGLVEEVFKEAIRRHAAEVTDFSKTGTGRERLLHLVTKSAELYGSGTPFHGLLMRLHVEAGASRKHLAPIARKVQQRQREYMTDLVSAGQKDGSIRSDIDPAAVGQMVNATLQGLLVQQLEPPSQQRAAAEDFGELLDQLL
ncbi:MAG TPA: TetR/AcrR family transcriptional regulator [Solirubrobacterales bacterium]|nr:TetR/AcrR family transcriptional regulator [Solirubrobacterales bacterium]